MSPVSVVARSWRRTCATIAEANRKTPTHWQRRDRCQFVGVAMGANEPAWRDHLREISDRSFFGGFAVDGICEDLRRTSLEFPGSLIRACRAEPTHCALGRL